MKLWLRILSVLSLVFGSFLVGNSTAQAIAAGCTADKPTYVGGTIVGYPNNYALNAHIGTSVGYYDSSGKLRIVMPDGTPNTSTQGDYSWVDRINSDLPASGAPTGNKTWGTCVSSKVTVFFSEIYPKAPGPDPLTQRTDKSTYGSSAYYSGRVSVGQRLNLLLRAPVTYQAGNGNTGGIQGYVFNGTGYLPAANITGIRAFPGPGSSCGVEGYSAAADRLGSATNPDRTYYKLDYLAGGQCGASYQSYLIQVNTNIGKTYSRVVNIVKGQWPRVDIHF